MYRGIALVLGPTDARFSMLYVDDLAEAVTQWLECETPPGRMFELHDGRPEGYRWDDLITIMSRVRDGRVRRIRIPGAFLSLLAAINVTAASALGFSPMLTPGKVRELRHSDWVCDNTPFTRETGWVPRVGLEEGFRSTLNPDRGIPHHCKNGGTLR
jgi:nucleoside-diphosphate-sugar epimerase